MKKPAKFAAAAAALVLAGCAVVPTRYGPAVEALPAPVVAPPFFGPAPYFGPVPLVPVPFDAPEFPLPEFSYDYPENGAVVPGPYGIPEHIPVFRNE